MCRINVSGSEIQTSEVSGFAWFNFPNNFWRNMYGFCFRETRCSQKEKIFFIINGTSFSWNLWILISRSDFLRDFVGIKIKVHEWVDAWIRYIFSLIFVLSRESPSIFLSMRVCVKTKGKSAWLRDWVPLWAMRGLFLSTFCTIYYWNQAKQQAIL